MKAALIDHDDSFTQNLRHWLKPLFAQIDVISHQDFFDSERALKLGLYDVVVLSPGPKNPSDYPQTLEWLRNTSKDVAVFGVCLGLQMMVCSQGGLVETYSAPLHGKKSKLQILKKEFSKLDQCEVARYHSLFCKESIGFETLAIAEDDKIPMWLKHSTKKWLGVQFHPESFLTENPEQHLIYLKEWLNA